MPMTSDDDDPADGVSAPQRSALSGALVGRIVLVAINAPLLVLFAFVYFFHPAASALPSVQPPTFTAQPILTVQSGAESTATSVSTATATTPTWHGATPTATPAPPRVTPTVPIGGG
jgi:hypothetical protein